MIKMIRGHTTGGRRIELIPARDIHRSSLRPHREQDSLLSLADSIHRHGILVPLTVCRGAEGDYILVSGERRLCAAQMLGLELLPCIVLPHSEQVCAEFALIESLQNREFNLFEQAEAISRLINDCKMSREEAAARLSCSQSYISNKLRLLRLEPGERELILAHSLSERHARALLRLADPCERRGVLMQMIARPMTVAAAEELVEQRIKDRLDRPERPKGRAVRDISPFINTVERALQALERNGVSSTLERIDSDGFCEIRIRIPTAPS